jgi:hypothetical protein
MARVAHVLDTQSWSMILKSDRSKEQHFVTDQFIKPQPFKSQILQPPFVSSDMIIHNYELLTVQQGLLKE